MDQYPQQTLSNFPQPGYPVQAPRKNRTGLWIVLVVVVLAVAAGVGIFLYQQRVQNSPTATLQKYCDGWKTGNAQEIYDTFSSNMRLQTSQEIVQQLLNGLAANGAKIDCTVSNVQENGSTATGTITLTATTPSGTHTDKFPLPLIQENGDWKINFVVPSKL